MIRCFTATILTLKQRKRRVKMDIFENYLLQIENQDHRALLRKTLHWVQKSFPPLEPRIAWNQPMFTDHGTFIIGFSIAKRHFTVAPEAKGMERFSSEIERAGYSQTPNLFRIKWGEPVDYPLLERIIQFNREDKADCPTFWRKSEVSRQ